MAINWSSLFCLVSFLLLLSAPYPVSAQDSKGAWILGHWEGKHSGQAIPDDAARFEFVADGDVIKWTMNRKGRVTVRNAAGYVETREGDWQASGVVKKISEGSVELEGKYDSSSFSLVVGRSANYELNGTPETLQGKLWGVANVGIPIILRRMK